MYLRFIGFEKNEDSGKPIGIFSVAYDFVSGGKLLDYEENEFRVLLNWFKTNLSIPKKFSRKKNDSHKNHKGISWMKEENSDCLQKLWELKVLLNRHDIIIDVLKTRKPGYIVYEDDHQVVAESFNREVVKKI